MARNLPERRELADPVGFGVAAVGAAVVTVVCAVASYSHIEHLAQAAGQGQLARWLPLGVDGLVASSTASLLVDRRAGRPTGLSAVLGLALGLTGSLAGNLVAVDPTLVSPRAVRLALAGYPPVALALAGHVLLTMLLGSTAEPTVNVRDTRAADRKGMAPNVKGAERKKAQPKPGLPAALALRDPIVTGGYDSPEVSPPIAEARAGRIATTVTEGYDSPGDRRPATFADAERVAAQLERISQRRLGDALRAKNLTCPNSTLAEWADLLKAERATAPEPRPLEVVR